MNKQEITNLINSTIIDNDNGLITAETMRDVLNAINEGTGDGYTFISTATPSTTPIAITGDSKVFYITTEEGDYSNFGLGNISELSVIKSENGSWKIEGLGMDFLGAALKIEQGGINSASGNNYNSPSSCRNKGYLKAPFYIRMADDFQCRLYTYNKGTLISSGSWMTEITADNPTYKYRIIFRKADSSEITADDVIIDAYIDRINYAFVKGVDYANTANTANTTNTANTANDVKDGIITPNKCTFFSVSKNIVDWDNLDIRDWAINGGAASSSYKSTEYILLKPNTTYTINEGVRLIWGYKDDAVNPFTANKFPTKVQYAVSTVGLTTFTTDSENVYVRMQFPISTFDVDSIMLVEGSELPLEYEPYKKIIDPTYLPSTLKNKRTITAIGASGEAHLSGGQYMLTDEQKNRYGVESDLVMAKVVQVLLDYDETNICAVGGFTASNTMFTAGLTSYIFKKDVILPKNKSVVSYPWDLDSIGAQMTENLTTISGPKIGAFTGYVNGVKVIVDAKNGTINLAEDRDRDVHIEAGSLVTRIARTAINDGTVTKKINDSEGLILQIGANSEGATPEEILAYCELAIKASSCKWFVVMAKNGKGIMGDSDLDLAVPLLKKRFGSRFIDHKKYMASIEALNDQGIVPTTSEDYPDDNGVNSNPLTANQISNGVKSDMECLSKGLYPSSFWHSAYRDNEPNNQTINDSHFNAQAIECWGRYVANYIREIIL